MSAEAVGENTAFSLNQGVVAAAVFLLTATLVKAAVGAISGKGTQLPPGPWGLPLFGYLPFLGPDPPATLNRLRHKYGDVMGLRLGAWPAVVVSGREVIREALVSRGDDFSGRPDLMVAGMLGSGTDLVFSPACPAWRVQRKAISKALLALTNARKSVFQDTVCSEAKTIISELLAHEGDSFCPKPILEIAAVSVIHKLCYGPQFQGRENGEFRKIINRNRAFTAFASGSLINFMPWLRFFMPSEVNRVLKCLSDDTKRNDSQIHEHESTLDENHVRDIADSLLHAGNSLTEEQRSAGMCKHHLTASLLRVLGAAGDTVGSVIQWFVFLMAANPDIQEDVFGDIDTVVGQGRDVSLADRPSLPLVEAAIWETMRVAGAAPLAIPHCTTRDTTLRGHHIAKGTVVLVNLSSVSVDPEVWDDPQAFRPQRFVAEGGQLDVDKVKRLIPFSLGQRRCVGEPVARMELFLFLVTLIQRLRFLRPPGHPEYSVQSHFSISPLPGHYRLCVAPRH